MQGGSCHLALPWIICRCILLLHTSGIADMQEEVELAAAELEAVQSRLLALEAQKDNLQAKLEASRQDAAAAATHGSSNSSVEETLRQELNSQREVSTRLRQDLATARQLLHDKEAQWDER